jgi:hypothetical protein
MPIHRRSSKPQLEELESRLVPATYTVTLGGDANAADPADATGASGTFRYCLNQANLAPGNVVKFALPAGTLIQLTSALPVMNVSVTIDASDVLTAAGRPAIQVQGLNNGLGAPVFGGLVLDGGNSVVRGLDFCSFDGTAIVLENRGGDLVTNCMIGTDLSGLHRVQGLGAAGGPDGGIVQYGDTGDGIYINNCGQNTIGGATAVSGNQIVNNQGAGVHIQGANAVNNLVVSNNIGADVTGTRRLENATGIWIDNAPNNTIGGDFTSFGNLISGNHGSGVLIQWQGSHDNLVYGNLIGVAAGGLRRLDNRVGVQIRDGAHHNDIGDVSLLGLTLRNVISGNRIDGVYITGEQTMQNRVLNNYIGVGMDGFSAVGNEMNGVHIENAPENRVGDVQTPGQGNVIAGQMDGNGVLIEQAGATGNQVFGNLIGLTANGLNPLSNPVGVRVTEAGGNTIGGAVPGARNLISGNLKEGILLSQAPGTVILGNWVGLTITGAFAMGNGLQRHRRRRGLRQHHRRWGAQLHQQQRGLRQRGPGRERGGCRRGGGRHRHLHRRAPPGAGVSSDPRPTRAALWCWRPTSRSPATWSARTRPG